MDELRHAYDSKTDKPACGDATGRYFAWQARDITCEDCKKATAR